MFDSSAFPASYGVLRVLFSGSATCCCSGSRWLVLSSLSSYLLCSSVCSGVSCPASDMYASMNSSSNRPSSPGSRFAYCASSWVSFSPATSLDVRNLSGRLIRCVFFCLPCVAALSFCFCACRSSAFHWSSTSVVVLGSRVSFPSSMVYFARHASSSISTSSGY